MCKGSTAIQQEKETKMVIENRRREARTGRVGEGRKGRGNREGVNVYRWTWKYITETAGRTFSFL